jgi:hypothetical protein
MDFSFYYFPKGKNGGFIVKWLTRVVCTSPPPDFPHVQDLVGRKNLGFRDLSCMVCSHILIYFLGNPFKFKFELPQHKV